MTTKRTELWLGWAIAGGLLLFVPGCGNAQEPPVEEPIESMTAAPTLADAVAANPLPGFAAWWPIGDEFTALMSDAIVSEWSELAGNDGGLDAVGGHVTEYLDVVYQREARASLVQDFTDPTVSTPLQSGEFDALSYAFYRSAFDLIDAHLDAYEEPLEAERRQFTRRVGARAFAALADRLGFELPAGLDDEASFEMLKAAIDSITAFLKSQGYFRDHGAFVFEVDVEHLGQRLGQPEAEFVARLQTEGSAHALFEMGYPVILPSAIYLFATVGEAQHHSSRTVEELFARIGYVASETHDFDPSGYPPDMVVELWEIATR